MQAFRLDKRARPAALVLLAALGAVLAIHLAIGLSDILLFGLVGGLVGSLIVIGLDLLHTARLATDRNPATGDGADTLGETR